MKKLHILLIGISLISLIFDSRDAGAWSKITHQRLNEIAAQESKIDFYLKDHLCIT